MKNSSSVIDKVVVVFVIFILGLLIGTIIQSEQIIELDNKVKIFEVINWITTIFVGFIIGYFLKNKFENHKTIKNYLCSDLTDIIGILKESSVFFYSKRELQKFSDIDRLEINSKMNYIDKKISTFYELLEDSKVFNSKQLDEIKNKLTEKHISLNQFVTGDDVYLENIPKEFFDEVLNSYLAYEYYIKNIVFTITRK